MALRRTSLTRSRGVPPLVPSGTIATARQPPGRAGARGREAKKLIVEVRVNEYAPRHRNPNVPGPRGDRATRGACRARARASSTSTRAGPTAAPSTRTSYRDTVRSIRQASDILIHPTLGYVTLNAPHPERLSHPAAWWRTARRRTSRPMDMGSPTSASALPRAAHIPEPRGRVYQNSNGDATLHFADHIRAHGLKPYLQIWNISFMREMNQFYRQVGLTPRCLRVHCTDNHCIGGHPGTPRAAGVHRLPAGRACRWSGPSATSAATCRPGRASHRPGGHVSIGLGDYHCNELGSPPSRGGVADIARSMGHRLATPARRGRCSACSEPLVDPSSPRENPHANTSQLHQAGIALAAAVLAPWSRAPSPSPLARAGLPARHLLAQLALEDGDESAGSGGRLLQIQVLPGGGAVAGGGAGRRAQRHHRWQLHGGLLFASKDPAFTLLGDTGGVQRM